VFASEVLLLVRTFLSGTYEFVRRNSVEDFVAQTETRYGRLDRKTTWN
jgi:hypothetical protein